MNDMPCVADRPGVQNVLRGEHGVIEQYNVHENEYMLASYSPITKYGWGALVTIPVDSAYRPINNATSWFLVFTALMILLAIAAAGLISINIVDPVLHMITATRSMPYGDYKKDLPLARPDEIGDLARSFDHMATDIRDSQQKILAARDQAEEERDRAELYVDIMGHDINNLNQTALANLELIESGPELPEDLREYIQSAITSVEGSAGIIENVRKIQQITGEKLYFEKEDVNDLITRCIEEAHRPQDKKVTINYTGRPGMIISGTNSVKNTAALFRTNILNAATVSLYEQYMRLFPKLMPGELEEHVLERRPPHVYRVHMQFPTRPIRNNASSVACGSVVPAMYVPLWLCSSVNTPGIVRKQSSGRPVRTENSSRE
jgi:signal transduction histidine kinase